MKIRKLLVGFLLLVAGLVVGMLVAGQLYKPVDLAAPAGASKALQQAIIDAGTPDVALSKLLVPQSVDQWHSAIALRAESRAVSLDELATDLNVTITRDVIAGVAVHRVVPNDVVLGKGLFIYIHGGAYVFGGGDAALDIVSYDQDDGRHIPSMTSKAVGIRLKRGHRIHIESPGGGGYGPAVERDPAMVALDVRQGFVSRDNARAQYGVVLTETGDVDSAATQEIRNTMMAAE